MKSNILDRIDGEFLFRLAKDKNVHPVDLATITDARDLARMLLEALIEIEQMIHTGEVNEGTMQIAAHAIFTGVNMPIALSMKQAKENQDDYTEEQQQEDNELIRESGQFGMGA